MEYTIHIGGFGQMFGVPNAVVDQYLKLSTPSQLKVLLYLLRHGDHSVEQQEVASVLSISEELVEEALLFWSQTDLFLAPEAQTAEVKTAEPQTAASESEHSLSIPGIIASSKGGELSPVEISAALEQSEDLKTLFRLVEKQLGRPLRHVEQKSLVWMHDYNDISSEIILTMLLYAQSVGKPTVNYAEGIITSWWNEGIQTLAQVNETIQTIEYRRSFTGHIQKAFEMHRKPTPKQQEMINRWQDQQIPLELITYAYEKTVESTDKLSFPYLDAVLRRWMEAGYRTRSDVDAKDHKPAGSEKKASPKKAVPESDNAEAYRSFVLNVDEWDSSDGLVLAGKDQ